MSHSTVERKGFTCMSALEEKVGIRAKVRAEGEKKSHEHALLKRGDRTSLFDGGSRLTLDGERGGKETRLELRTKRKQELVI